jgi:tetratricopeptide (TPR) repeat protein
VQVDIQGQIAAAWVLYAEGKREEALKAMGAAADAEDKTEKHPVTPGVPRPARELYGVMLLESGMAGEALAAFEQAEKADPTFPKTHYMLGLTYANLDKKDLAKEHLAKFLEMAPSDENAETAKMMLDELKK